MKNVASHAHGDKDAPINHDARDRVCLLSAKEAARKRKKKGAARRRACHAPKCCCSR